MKRLVFTQAGRYCNCSGQFELVDVEHVHILPAEELITGQLDGDGMATVQMISSTALTWDTEPNSVLPYDLHTDPITVAQAAELADVTDDVIRQWIRRRHITPVKRTPGGRPLLLGIAVLRAKAKLHPTHGRKLTTAT